MIRYVIRWADGSKPVHFDENEVSTTAEKYGFDAAALEFGEIELRDECELVCGWVMFDGETNVGTETMRIESLELGMNAKSKIARLAAAKWRKENRGHSGGVVLVYGGKVYGWKNELRDPSHEKPGACAVDHNGVVFVATGGDSYNGAQCWERTSEGGAS